MASCYVVVETGEEFERLADEQTAVVSFANQAEESAYERLDNGLAERLQALLADMFGESNDGELYHQNWDWWPDRTRMLEIDSLCVTWILVERIQALLTGDVEDWRVSILVAPFVEGSETVGLFIIYRDWILMQRPVLDLLPNSHARHQVL